MKEITKPEKPKHKKKWKQSPPESYTLQYENPAMKQSPKSSRDLMKDDMMEMKVVEIKQQHDVTKDGFLGNVDENQDLPRYSQVESKG